MMTGSSIGNRLRVAFSGPQGRYIRHLDVNHYSAPPLDLFQHRCALSLLREAYYAVELPSSMVYGKEQSEETLSRH